MTTDNLIINIILFAVGLALICVAGDKLVDAAVVIAKKLGIPQIVVGATIVSVGTTLPEVLVSTTAAIQGSVEITAGNALGSIICNTTLIAGLAQLIKPTKSVNTKSLGWRSIFFFGTMIVVNIVAYFTGGLRIVSGICLLLTFVVYAYLNVKFPGEDDEDDGEKKEGKIVKELIILLVGAGLLYVGAKLLVDNGVYLATEIGVPERVIAVTFIALGTSLPELMTSIISIIKGYGNVGLGNILGANLFNLLLVLGIPALRGYEVAKEASLIDMPLGLIVMAILIVPILIRKKGSRWQGAVLLAIYAGYCVMTFSGFSLF